MAVLLSNHPRFLSTLDESTRSSLQPELIHFRNYDADQIQQILMDRAHQGLHSTPEGLIARIAAMTTRLTNSDVRIAIKTLYHAAVEQARDIEHVFNRARRDLVRDLLVDLNDRCLLMLRAVSSATEIVVKAVYQRYRRLSHDMGEEPFSYVYFYTNLSYLQSLGLILLVSTKLGRTYTNRIQLLFDAELLEAICRTRFDESGLR